MGSGGVAIAALPTVICLKVPFSDGLGGGTKEAFYNFYNTNRHGMMPRHNPMSVCGSLIIFSCMTHYTQQPTHYI